MVVSSHRGHGSPQPTAAPRAGGRRGRPGVCPSAPRAGRPAMGQPFQGETPCAPFQKIKAVYDTNPAKFRTLQNILEVEKEMYGAQWPKVGATLALMWLKR